MEALLTLWAACWLLAAAYVPTAAAGALCRRQRPLRRQRLDERSPTHRRPAWRACALHTLLLLLIACAAVMLAGSEQTKRSIDAATGGGSGGDGRAAVALADVARFARNSEMQIAFVAATSLEVAFAAVERDLQDAENLLGRPIRETLGERYNLDGTFQALQLIQQDSVDIARTVADIKGTCAAAAAVGEQLQRRLDELVPAVRSARHACAGQDAPLCDTITENGLTVTFDANALMNDGKSIYLTAIAGPTHFNASLHEAQRNYEEMARRVVLDTHDQRAAIRAALQRHRGGVHKRLQRLEHTARSVIASVRRVGDALGPYRDAIVAWEMWRYLLTLVSVLVLVAAWTLLLCATPCCGTGAKDACAACGAVLAALAAALCWCVGTGALLAGVHAEAFVCRALYDPTHATLAALLDDGGLLVPEGGLLRRELNLNESVRVADALRAMEDNKTVYKAFRLQSLLDVDALTDYKQWPDVVDALGRVRVQRPPQLLTPPLESALRDFADADGVNLTLVRARASRPTVARDLHALLDQLYATAAHLRDAHAVARMEHVAGQLRDVVEREYKQLNDAQDRLVYHVTALEVRLAPLVRRARSARADLVEFQRAMSTELDAIVTTHVRSYTSRLEDYLAQFRANVLYEITHRTARAGPLWGIFAAVRATLCDGCVDGINALSFASYASILVLACLQPVLRTLVRERDGGNQANARTSTIMLRRSASEELIRQTPPNWRSPRENQRAGSPDMIVRDLEEGVWMSPRQSYESHLPPSPPRQPSEATLDAGYYAAPARYSPTAIEFGRASRNVARDGDASSPPSTRRWI